MKPNSEHLEYYQARIKENIDIFCLSKPWDETLHQECVIISYIWLNTILFRVVLIECRKN